MSSCACASVHLTRNAEQWLQARARRAARATASTPRSEGSVLSSARAYFASDVSRSLQTALAVLWLLDGALQFQSFMYSKGFINMLTAMAAGQPVWLSSSLTWAAHTAGRDLTVFNTAFALVQVTIGLGLLYRPTVRFALALSIVWALIVWWSGEAFGMLFMSMASPLTGAPGAVSLYGLLALIAWPNGRPGGLLGITRHSRRLGERMAADGLAVAGGSEQQPGRNQRRDQRCAIGDELVDNRAGLGCEWKRRARIANRAVRRPRCRW